MGALASTCACPSPSFGPPASAFCEEKSDHPCPQKRLMGGPGNRPPPGQTWQGERVLIRLRILPALYSSGEAWRRGRPTVYNIAPGGYSETPKLRQPETQNLRETPKTSKLLKSTCFPNRIGARARFSQPFGARAESVAHVFPTALGRALGHGSTRQSSTEEQWGHRLRRTSKILDSMRDGECWGGGF